MLKYSNSFLWVVVDSQTVAGVLYFLPIYQHEPLTLHHDTIGPADSPGGINLEASPLYCIVVTN